MELVSTRIDNRIAVVTIDNPPVSTGNLALRTALLGAFEALADRTDIDAVVLRSALSHFYSGSDIKEFDSEIAHPSLPEVIEVIDGLHVPVVAALNGLTLGGGLEVALACDARVAARGTKLGLPEVTLGMVPGAGGTVRLPRLVGVAKAIEIITSGRPIGADEALAIGLVDSVVDGEILEESAISIARTAVKRNSRQQEPPHCSDEQIEKAFAAAVKGGRSRPNIAQAAELARDGVGLDSRDALVAERRVFEELRIGAEARNLRYLFFAKRAAAKSLTVDAIPRVVSTIGIAGAGTMGSAIAAACLGAGFTVVLFELNDSVLTRAIAALTERQSSAKRWGELRHTQDIHDLSTVDLVIDAVFEETKVKTDLFAGLEDVVGENVVLASNTSYLNLDELAMNLRHPERFIGLHFFNPADRNPLLEVIRTATSSDEALATVGALVKVLGKSGILAKVSEGFVANRVYADYRGQAEFLLEDGASPQEVDAAMVELGLPIGPFAVGDMSGLDIAWSRRKRLEATRDPRHRYVHIPDRLCEAGRLGKKSGMGWYDYPAGASRGVVDPRVDEIIAQERSAKSITPRPVSTREIQQRIVCAMIAAASEVVSEKVAQRASDIDVAMTEGFAFPRWLGGPLRYGSAQTTEWLLEGFDLLRRSDPVAYAGLESAAGVLPEAVSKVLEQVRA
jgi:3-hydroxyacyl-CoA dehydrogenase